MEGLPKKLMIMIYLSPNNSIPKVLVLVLVMANWSHTYSSIFILNVLTSTFVTFLLELLELITYTSPSPAFLITIKKGSLFLCDGGTKSGSSAILIVRAFSSNWEWTVCKTGFPLSSFAQF